MDEFYRKARKYLKLEDSREALRKAKGVAANKKNNPGTVPDGDKEKDEIGRKQRAKSPKKKRSGPVETEVHPRNTPITIPSMPY